MCLIMMQGNQEPWSLPTYNHPIITLDQWFQPVSIQHYFHSLDYVHDHSCPYMHLVALSVRDYVTGWWRPVGLGVWKILAASLVD